MNCFKSMKSHLFIVIIILLIVSNGYCRDLIKVTFEPYRDPYLFGNKVILRFQLENLTDQKVHLRGRSQYNTLRRKGSAPPDWEKWGRYFGGHTLLEPYEKKELPFERYIYLNELPSEIERPDKDSGLSGYFPLGDFVAYSRIDVYVPETRENQDVFSTCEFSVIMPEGDELEILNQYLLAKEYERNNERELAIIIYEDILSNHAESEYLDNAFYALPRSEEYVEWSNWYLNTFPDCDLYSRGFDIAIDR